MPASAWAIFAALASFAGGIIRNDWLASSSQRLDTQHAFPGAHAACSEKPGYILEG